MSIEALSSVLHHSKASHTTLLVAIGIANHQGDGGAYPSRGTLAKYARCSDRQVTRAIHDLIEMGELTVQFSKGVNGTNVYRIEIPCPEDCDRSTNHRPSTPTSTPWTKTTQTLDTYVYTPSTPTSSKPSYNLNLTNAKLEKENARLDREHRLSATQQLREEMAQAKANAAPMPNCKHNKPLLQCIPCCKELESEQA